MLDRSQTRLETHCFVVTAELAQDGKTPEQAYVRNAISDALRYIEGVGAVEVESLGLLQTEEDPIGDNQ